MSERLPRLGVGAPPAGLTGRSQRAGQPGNTFPQVNSGLLVPRA